LQIVPPSALKHAGTVFAAGIGTGKELGKEARAGKPRKRFRNYEGLTSFIQNRLIQVMLYNA
jgi:hypothetical protein